MLLKPSWLFYSSGGSQQSSFYIILQFQHGISNDSPASMLQSSLLAVEFIDLDNHLSDIDKLGSLLNGLRKLEALMTSMYRNPFIYSFRVFYVEKKD